MMDTKDGYKDETITGSIWNECIASSDSSMKIGEDKTITNSEAFNVLLKYLRNVSEGTFQNILSAFNIERIEQGGKFVRTDDDGNKYIEEYNSEGEITKATEYKGENIVSVTEYNNGKKQRETGFRNDGTSYMSEYDNGNMIRINSYGRDGNLELVMDFVENKTTYYNQDSTVKCTKYTNYHTNRGKYITTTYNSKGKKEREEVTFNNDTKEITYYDEDSGTRRYVEFYNAKGKITRRTFYRPYEGTIRLDEQYNDDGYCTVKTYDVSGKMIGSERVDALQALLPDGIVGDSAQKGQGDCYLMATINSIRQTTNGQEYINSLIKKEGDSYVVTLPGAKVAANNLLQKEEIDPNKMYITGTYVFNEHEVHNILLQAGERYSADDGDTILLEAAYEKYRMEVYHTLEDNNLNGGTEAGLNTGSNPGNILSGGRPDEAVFILTGAKSETYFDDGPTIAYEAFMYESGPFASKTKNNNNTNSVTVDDIDITGSDGNTMSRFCIQQTDLKQMLYKIKKDEHDGTKDYICNCQFFNDKGEGHVFTIKSVTNNSVVLINPWYPDRITTMNIDEFMSKVSKVTIAELPKRVV